MKVTKQIELSPWGVIETVTGIVKKGDDTHNINYHISELTSEELSEQLKRFRADVFKAAGLSDPLTFTFTKPLKKV